VYTAGRDGCCYRIPVTTSEVAAGQQPMPRLGSAGSEALVGRAQDRAFGAVAVAGERIALCCTTGEVYTGTVGGGVSVLSVDEAAGVAEASMNVPLDAPPPALSEDDWIDPEGGGQQPDPVGTAPDAPVDLASAPPSRASPAPAAGAAITMTRDQLADIAAELNQLMLESDSDEAVGLIARICGRWAKECGSDADRVEWQLLNVVGLRRPRALMLKILRDASSSADVDGMVDAATGVSAFTNAADCRALNTVGSGKLAKFLTGGNVVDAVQFCEETEQCGHPPIP
jgi:hypothetical protein